MKLLDKYIIKRILSTFFFVVLILVAIIAVIDITEKIDKFARNNLGSAEILQYYLDFIPWIAGLITPITTFIAIVYVTSRMAAHTEIIAILSSGISFNRLLLPYFIAALIIASLSFVLNGWIIPKSNRDRLTFEMANFENKFFYDHRNVHIQIEPNVILYLQNYNNQSNQGYQFSLERFDKNRLVEKLTADNIQWDSVKNKWTLRFWKQKRVDDVFVKGDSVMPATSGESMDTTLALAPADFANDKRSFDGMTINELGKHIDKLKFRGSSGVQVYEVEWHIRFAAPCTIFVLSFMGMIVSSRKSRGGTGAQIALGFLLSFVFILFFTTTRTFAEAGSMSPVLAAWLPNICFSVISAMMYKYVPR